MNEQCDRCSWRKSCTKPEPKEDWDCNDFEDAFAPVEYPGPSDESIKLVEAERRKNAQASAEFYRSLMVGRTYLHFK